MSLDLGETILQLDRLAGNLAQTHHDRQGQLRALLESARQVTSDLAREKTRFAQERPFLAAQVEDSLTGSYSPIEPPPSWRVASVDGSHIDVDRHLPVRCYLINLGGCVLTYGAIPDARFFSQPSLASRPEELYLSDPASSSSEEVVQGPLLGLIRATQELARLVAVVKESPPDLPTLALVDGTLVMWGLAGQGYKDHVRQAIINERFLVALEELRELSKQRDITLAAYVSLPRSSEVINAIRCCLCPHELARCKDSCSSHRSAQAPCQNANEFLDRELFREMLPPGWRSPVYLTNSSISRLYYGEHQVHFYYLHAGEEIARVEVPRWVAEDEKLLSLSHSLILDQCQRGQGYPVAISEAHEQAVINGHDRQLFKQMVAETLERQGLSAYTSEKERSKRVPWL